MYAESYTTPIEEIKDDPNEWRDIFCSWIVKISVFPKLLYGFNTILLKLAATFSVATKKSMLKFVLKVEGTKITKVIVNEKSKVRITLPEVKVPYVVTLIKMVWCWQRGRHLDQWNGTENPNIDPQKYSQLFCNQGAKGTFNGRRNKEPFQLIVLE